MRMYNHGRSRKVILEYYDDITTEDINGNLHSYQVTRSDDLKGIRQEKITKSMEKFLDLCHDRNHASFCLVANQKMGDITSKINYMKKLTDDMIKKYAQILGVQENISKLKDCFKKMNFLIVSDSLVLEYLIEKEIVYSQNELPWHRIKCIKTKLIDLVATRSRTAEKDTSEFYTETDTSKREEHKLNESTIVPEDIKELFTTCTQEDYPDIQIEQVQELMNYDSGEISNLIRKMMN